MIESVAELYVHAIAIEREAAERYAEFATRMADEGNDEVAAIFARLAGLEAEHLAALKRRTQGVALPLLGSDYSWLDSGPPETAAHDLVFRLMTARQAVAIALQAEKRAYAFFSHVARVASDPALRALAREMAMDEEQHIALLVDLLARTPNPFLPEVEVFR
jgi:rubrerythrin